MSHPVWVRGLKLYQSNATRMVSLVAPRVGAWIETRYLPFLFVRIMSHPVWVRGLKHRPEYYKIEVKESHPVWVRGLKLALIPIEQGKRGRRTPCGCVD